MHMHEMSVAARLESIVHIAGLLAGAGAHAAFTHEQDPLVFVCRSTRPLGVPAPMTILHVTAPGEDNTWTLQAPAGAAAESALTYTMLLSLAHDAKVCPGCRAKMPRNAERTADGLKHYDCAFCGMLVTERESLLPALGD